MTISTSKKPMLRVVLAVSDPLRLVGFRALLESESDLELISTPLPEIALQENIDVVLIEDRPGHSLFDTLSSLKMMRPNLPIIVVGASTNDEIMLNAIVCGAKGYVFDGAPPSEFARAIRVVTVRCALGSECFNASNRKAAFGKGKYCSAACRGAAQAAKSREKRAWQASNPEMVGIQ